MHCGERRVMRDKRFMPAASHGFGYINVLEITEAAT
jgi:hypothetical protein